MSDMTKGKVPLHIRRIVTGTDATGAAVIASDASPPRTDAFTAIPGMMSRLVWATAQGEAVPYNGIDPSSAIDNVVPEPGETRMLVITFPPDAVYASPHFDPQAAAAENLAISPGLAERFEPDGMHSTPTIDYGIVLDGEIWLDLGNGSPTLLKPLDVFVQNGTRHAWRNKSDRPATIAVVLIGARQTT